MAKDGQDQTILELQYIRLRTLAFASQEMGLLESF